MLFVTAGIDRPELRRGRDPKFRQRNSSIAPAGRRRSRSGPWRGEYDQRSSRLPIIEAVDGATAEASLRRSSAQAFRANETQVWHAAPGCRMEKERRWRTG
jgi:hypothetical protein